jgi:tRNA(fMet)-specific endonuclease VapC
MFLLDTDHITIIQWQSQPAYDRLVERMDPLSDFFFPIVSFHEQALGANAYISKASDATGIVRGYRILQKIVAGFAEAQVLPFDEAAATVFTGLRAQRIRISTMDLRIASIALSRDMAVLTRNLSDFRKVPGLKVADWTV